MALNKEVIGDIRVETADGSFIPGSRRDNGTWRKARKIKKGYVPQEEQPIYKVKVRTFSAGVNDAVVKAPMGITPRQMHSTVGSSRDQARRINQTEVQLDRSDLTFPTLSSNSERCQNNIEAAAELGTRRNRRWLPNEVSKIHLEEYRSNRYSGSVVSNTHTTSTVRSSTELMRNDDRYRLSSEVSNSHNQRPVTFADRSNIDAEDRYGFAQVTMAADKFNQTRDRKVQLVDVANYHNRRRVTFSDHVDVHVGNSSNTRPIIETSAEVNGSQNRKAQVAGIEKCRNRRRVVFCDAYNVDIRNKPSMVQSIATGEEFIRNRARNDQIKEVRKYQNRKQVSFRHNETDVENYTVEGYTEINRDINRNISPKEVRNSEVWRRVSFPYLPSTDPNSFPNLNMQNVKDANQLEPVYAVIRKSVAKTNTCKKWEQRTNDMQITSKEMGLREEEMENKLPECSTVRRTSSDYDVYKLAERLQFM